MVAAMAVTADRGATVQRVRSDMNRIRSELETLVRIPSVSHPGHDPQHVKRSAEETARILGAAGMRTEILQHADGGPAAVGWIPAPAGAPTVLLYAHHDVQPTGPRELWHTDPFEPVEHSGRLYGRGTSDDKCGVAIHAAAIRAWGGKPPVGVIVFVEGEEEWLSPSLVPLLEEHRERLRADAVVLADSGMWRAGHPGLTVSLRGVVSCDVEVRTLDHAVHSGEFGGPVPDAITVLARTLAKLHDDRGNVAVPGLATGPSDPLDLTEEELRQQIGMRPGVRLIGDGGITERMWTKPAVDVLGIDSPRIEGSTNQLVPSARARVSMRIPPGQEGGAAQKALVDHLRASVPWGAEATITPRSKGQPYRIDPSGRAYDAMKRAMRETWGRDAVLMGQGGSIPFVFDFARLFPGASLLLTGAGDPTSNAHSEDESVSLDDLEKSCVAEALFFGYLAGH
jgi:acetylornithine deacetylase/succinyl-diaminopimelate desuccinylase-like protein